MVKQILYLARNIRAVIHVVNTISIVDMLSAIIIEFNVIDLYLCNFKSISGDRRNRVAVARCQWNRCLIIGYSMVEMVGSISINIY